MQAEGRNPGWAWRSGADFRCGAVCPVGPVLPDSAALHPGLYVIGAPLFSACGGAEVEGRSGLSAV